jgi:hypothetical protein
MVERYDIPIGGSYHDSGYCIDDFHTCVGEDEVIREKCKKALKSLSKSSSLFENVDANRIIYDRLEQPIIYDGSEQPEIEFRQSEGMNYSMFAQVLPFPLVLRLFSSPNTSLIHLQY